MRIFLLCLTILLSSCAEKGSSQKEKITAASTSAELVEQVIGEKQFSADYISSTRYIHIKIHPQSTMINGRWLDTRKILKAIAFKHPEVEKVFVGFKQGDVGLGNQDT